MEVTHHSDYDTHAIMGGGHTQGFGIINSAEFITVLSSTLYSDAFLAVIREVVCNAWDAHKITGKRNVPVEITLDQTALVIRDFGPGIDPNKMIEIYCTYGGSTKKDQEDQTGGFGLGSKSPFAYTNYFTVTSNFKKKKTIWAISRGSAETKGMPDARPIVSDLPTEDEGVEVNIPLNTGEDAAKFRKVIENVVAWGEMNVKLNGKTIRTIPVSHAKEGILFTDENPPTVNGLLYVRYGDVVYPIPTHREYETLYEGATALMKRTSMQWEDGGYEQYRRTALNAVFQAEPNTISITPSRESIHTSDRTIATVKGMLQKFVDQAGTLGSPEYALKRELEIMNKAFSKGKDSRAFLLMKNPIQNYYSNGGSDEGYKYRSMRGYFFSIEEVVIGMAANGFIYNDPEVLARSRKQRLAYVIKNDSVDRDLAIKLKNVLKANPHLWTNNSSATGFRHIHFTGLLSKATAKGLNPKNFIMWKRNGYAGRKSYAGQELYKTPSTLKNLVAMSRRVIMLVDSKAQITEHKHRHLKQVPGWDMVPEDRVQVYLMPGKKYASYDSTLSFLKKQGYIVIDLVDFYRKHYPPVKLEPKPKTEKPKAFRRKRDTYPLLSNLIGEDHYFDKELAKAQVNENTKMSSSPEFVVKGDNLRKGDWSAKFFPWGDAHATFLAKEYGSRAVVARNIIEYEKIKKAGAKDLNEFIIKDTCEKLLKDQELKAYLAMSNVWSGSPVGQRQYNDLIQHSKIGKMLPPVPVAQDVSLKRYQFFKDVGHMRVTLTLMGLWDLHQSTLKTLADWREDKSIFNPEKVFSAEASSRMEYFDIDEVIRDLKDPTTGPKQRAFLETLLVLTLF